MPYHHDVERIVEDALGRITSYQDPGPEQFKEALRYACWHSVEQFTANITRDRRMSGPGAASSGPSVADIELEKWLKRD